MTDAPERIRTARSSKPRDEQARGFLLGAAAYGMWGIFPLYWPLLEPAGAIELLAHRIVWSLVLMSVLLVALGRTPQLLTIVRDRRKRNLLTLASVVIALNWGGYIYGVTHGKVVEASLGYFINPLVTVLMGVLILGERLRRAQWVAIVVAFVAVVGLTVEYGRPPWLALLLAFSFGTYGLAKKQADVEAVESLTFETIVLTPLALGYLVLLGVSGQAHFLGHGVGHVALLVSSGLITAVPLICFSAAAIRVPMTTLGLLQYIAPVTQFVIGVAVVHEAMTPMRWVGFSLVWLALAIFTVEAIGQRRRTMRLVVDGAAL